MTFFTHGDSVEDWEQRYSRPGRKHKQPDDFLVQNAARLKPGRVLDVACGEGRNCIFLAKLGCFSEVVGVDWSQVGIDKTLSRAREEGLSMVRGVVQDLAELSGPLPLAKSLAQSFDAIVVTRYLQRSLCPYLEQALVPGGILLYETYTTQYLKYGPRRIEHLLQPGELPQLFPALEILLYQEIDKPHSCEATAQLLARRPL